MSSVRSPAIGWWCNAPGHRCSHARPRHGGGDLGADERSRARHRTGRVDVRRGSARPCLAPAGVAKRKPPARVVGFVACATSLAMTVALFGAMPPLVVIASIQMPLRALAGMPVPIGLVGPLSVETWAALPDAASTERRGDPGREQVISAARVDEASEPSAPSAIRVQPSRRTPCRRLLPLKTRRLCWHRRRSRKRLSYWARACARAHGDRRTRYWSRRLGDRASASRIGVATADVASRAGISVGRVFRDRGWAVANSF